MVALYQPGETIYVPPQRAGVRLSGGGAAWWQTDQSTRVFYGGLSSASFANNGFINGASTSPGRTFIVTQSSHRIRQWGYIRRVKAWFTAVGTGLPFKVKVFRPNGTNYDFVGESEALLPPGTGTQTVVLATPIACRPGDCVGFWMQHSNGVRMAATTAAGLAYGFVVGDTVTTVAAASLTALSDFLPAIEVDGVEPFFAVSGDSIAQGGNAGANWYPHLRQPLGISGTITSQIWEQMRLLYAPTMEYQNFARGSQTFDWVSTTGVPNAVSEAQANVILVHCGVNDVAEPRLWAAVEANLDTIRTATAGLDLWIDEILPWTAGDDTQAATIRTWNGNLATWCAANDAHLILCHDAMGQTRISTSALDDLLTAYDQDGVHLTLAGVQKMAQIIYQAFAAYYG